MSHRGGRRSTVPVLLVRRKPHDIPRPDFLDRSSIVLRPTKAGCNNQRLTKRMRMPGGAGSRFKRDSRATNARRFRRFEQRFNPYFTREPIRWSILSRHLQTTSLNFHLKAFSQIQVATHSTSSVSPVTPEKNKSDIVSHQ